MADGATVTVYAAASLCGDAKRELESQGARAGDLRVRIFCLAREGSEQNLDLAAVGANARRASQDSTTVGYIQPPGRATRFATPILESANIPTLTTGSGEEGMASLLEAIADADPSSLRDSVQEQL